MKYLLPVCACEKNIYIIICTRVHTGGLALLDCVPADHSALQNIVRLPLAEDRLVVDGIFTISLFSIFFEWIIRKLNEFKQHWLYGLLFHF